MEQQPAVSIEEQIACIRRELSMRRRVYPRWVAQSKMKPEDAEKQVAAMEAVLATLEGLRSEIASRTEPSLFSL